MQNCLGFPLCLFKFFCDIISMKHTVSCSVFKIQNRQFILLNQGILDGTKSQEWNLQVSKLMSRHSTNWAIYPHLPVLSVSLFEIMHIILFTNTWHSQEFVLDSQLEFFVIARCTKLLKTADHAQTQNGFCLPRQQITT